MEFNEYKREADRLYHEYMKLLQDADGVISLPTATYRLPGSWRPQYEKFEFIVNLTNTEENIVIQIEEFKNLILEKRVERINALETAFPRKAVVSDPPTRADGKRKDYKLIIQQAELALAVYQHGGTRLDTAKNIFGFDESDPDQDPKSNERKVRQYHAHAEMLIEAATNGTFFSALQKPLQKK